MAPVLHTLYEVLSILALYYTFAKKNYMLLLWSSSEEKETKALFWLLGSSHAQTCSSRGSVWRGAAVLLATWRPGRPTSTCLPTPARSGRLWLKVSIFEIKDGTEDPQNVSNVCKKIIAETFFLSFKWSETNMCLPLMEALCKLRNPMASSQQAVVNFQMDVKSSTLTTSLHSLPHLTSRIMV